MKEIIQKIKNIKINPFWGGILVGSISTIILLFLISFVGSQTEGTARLAGQSPVPTTIDYSPTPTTIVLPSSEIDKWITPTKITLDVFKSFKEIQDMVVHDEAGGYTSFSIDPQNAVFYKIAELKNGGYLARTSTDYDTVYFEVQGDSVIAILSESRYHGDSVKYILKPGIKIINGEIQDLQVFPKITVNSLNFESQYSDFVDLSGVLNKEFFGAPQNTNGKFYVTYDSVKNLTGFFNRNFYLLQPDGTGVSYEYSDGLPKYDSGVQKITWADGTNNQDQFISFFANDQCGHSFSRLVVKPTDFNPDLDGTVLGKTENGETLYKFKDGDHGLIRYVYDSYKSVEDSVYILSFDDFSKEENYFIWKDGVGDWQIWINQKHATMAECGKPVIYLYPTTQEKVNVQVGASLTKSEPLYPSAGWNVIASPDGTLTYDGVNYPYLFWEGLGNGVYPEVKNRGVVVKKEEVKDRLSDDLKKQGLNDKEISDFLDFWLPKMPNKPYVRLTWLNTLEMNKLAPLNVSPKPDTMIRVFLDFAGLDSSVDLQPQKLFAPQRSGFTLVEWGGLLIH